MRGKLISTLLFAAAFVAAPNVAKALTLNVTGGSVGLANLCADALCSSEPLPFVDGGALSGTLTIDGTDFSFDLTASVIGFEDGPDSLELQTVSYVAGPVTITGTSDDFTASGSASVSGGVSEDGGAASPLVIAAAPWTATCEETAGQLVCGISFAGFPFFAVQYDGSTHYVPHTLNPVAGVPEPGSFVMALTAGLFGLTYGRRKVTS